MFHVTIIILNIITYSSWFNMPVLIGDISIMKNMEASPWKCVEFTEYGFDNTANVFHYQLIKMCVTSAWS